MRLILENWSLLAILPCVLSFLLWLTWGDETATASAATKDTFWKKHGGTIVYLAVILGCIVVLNLIIREVKPNWWYALYNHNGTHNTFWIVWFTIWASFGVSRFTTESTPKKWGVFVRLVAICAGLAIMIFGGASVPQLINVAETKQTDLIPFPQHYPKGTFSDTFDVLKVVSTDVTTTSIVVEINGKEVIEYKTPQGEPVVLPHYTRTVRYKYPDRDFTITVLIPKET